MDSNQEHSLKLQCLEIASRELLETKGFIKQEELMKRARQLYVAAKAAGFDTWNMPEVKHVEPPKIVMEPIIDMPRPVSNEGFKICPNCGEEIPEKFKVHKYKADGSTCGQRFGVA